MKHPFEPHLQGHGVSPGIVQGPAFVLRKKKLVQVETHFQGVEVESERFRLAQRQVVNKIEKLAAKIQREVGSSEAEIFEAHLMMIQDEEFIGGVYEQIKAQKVTAERASELVFEAQIKVFEASDSDYMRERTLDLKDLQGQIARALAAEDDALFSAIQSPVILVAEDLTPTQTVNLERRNILGIITERGGSTSHTAILARTLGIPAIVGIEGACERLNIEGEMVMDGTDGTVYLLKENGIREYFFLKLQDQAQALRDSNQFRDKPTLTKDGHSVSLFANIGRPSDISAVTAGDAEGVGLFRSEFCFMEQSSAPTLHDQTQKYSEVLNYLAPKEVVIRTLDIGGDKPLTYVPMPHEENPFLGVRAIRFCLQHPDFFKTQIKALLLSNTKGNLSILIPMVSRVSEAKEVVELVHQCSQELQSHPDYRNEKFKIGVMVEIPALVFELRELAGLVSFVSVGTNDLLQYSVAVDRLNPALQSLYSPYNLGFIRMMKFLADEALAAGLGLGICGELGGNEAFVPLWIAMGYQKLSMSPKQILTVRSLISKLDLKLCRALLERVLCSSDEKAVKELLAQFVVQGNS